MLRKAIKTTFTVKNRRIIHAFPALYNAQPSSQHTSETYNKDVDPTPPSDSKIHRVDPSSENVQKPYEPPSSQWSQAGVETEEYRTVSKTEPYAAPGEDRRYGNKQTYAEDKGPETSNPGSGPEGAEAEGRKPEGR